MSAPVVNQLALREHIWSILTTDVLGRQGELPEESFRAMLIALCVVSGKGVLEWEHSEAILEAGWKRYEEKAQRFDPADRDEGEVRRAVYRMLGDQLVRPWSRLTLSSVHGLLLGALLVVCRGRTPLEALRKSFADTWNAYEIPAELLAS